MASKKGQLSFDFYIALIVFIGLIGYITFQLFQIVPASSENLKQESISIEAYQISELLINDPGHPLDWDTKLLGEIKRIGLSDSTKNITNYLSNAKIVRFKSLCANFGDIKNLLAIGYEAGFKIIEHKPAGDEIYDGCKSSEAKKSTFIVSRTVDISGTTYPTEIIVEVWRR